MKQSGEGWVRLVSEHRETSPASLPFSWRGALVLLAILTLAVYLGSAWTPALLDDADAGHAEVSREILERGDWVTFHMNGVRYLEKAPLLFWTGAVAYRVLGVNELATRLPLILAVLGTVLIGAAFGRAAGGDRAGFYAGLALATSFGVYLFTRIFIADILLTFCVTAALYCFWRARQAPVFAFGFWAGVAGAVLSKGLIGMIFPLAAAGLYVLVTGEWRLVRQLRPVAGLALFFLLAAPWHILASLGTPHFAWFYFVNEHFLRYLGRRYPKDYDKVPLLVFWVTNLVWLFPWSVYLPLAVANQEQGARSRKQGARSGEQEGEEEEGAPSRKQGAGTGALSVSRSPLPAPSLLWWIWAGVVLVFFSFSTRQEYYTMPAYPALALLLAQSLSRAEETDRTGKQEKRLVWLQAIPAAFGILAAISLGILLWLSRDIRPDADIAGLLSSNPQYYKLALGHMFDLRPETFGALRGPAASAAVVLGVGFPLAWWLRKRRRHLAASLATAATAAVFLLCAHSALVAFEPYLSSRPLAVAIDKLWRPGDRVVLDGEYYSGSSVGFYIRPKLFLLNGRMTGLEFGSRYPDCPPVFIGDADVRRWWEEAGRVFLVTDQVKRQRLERLLPPGQMHVVAASGGKFVFSNVP